MIDGGRTSRDASARLFAADRRASAGFWVMSELGVRMMVHDKLKSLGTVAGVVFAVVLSVQQIGVLLGLLAKNTMFVDEAGADIFVAPPETTLLEPGPLIPERALDRARVTEGVAIAAPLVLTGASVLKPDGGREAVTLVGTEAGAWLGGPWNLVAGSREALREPNTMIFEDSRRDNLGGLNLGSLGEINDRRMHVGGFTWGLLPFGPPYAFAEIRFAREVASLPLDSTHFVLVKVRPGVAPDDVAARLRSELPMLSVLTRQEYHDLIVRTLLAEQLGVSFATSTSFALIVGFVVVALSMFSSVLDHLRQFGTLKAIGCTNRDLTHLLVAQSVLFALGGSFVGLGLSSFIAEGIRSAALVMIVPPAMFAVVPIVMVVLCIGAATLALRRVRRLEPGMVFR